MENQLLPRTADQLILRNTSTPKHVNVPSAIRLDWKIKAILLLLFAGVLNTTDLCGQLLQWNTFGNAGTETTEPSVFNATGIAAANLTLGAGVTPVANGNRFGGNDWFDSGDSNPTSLAESVSGSDYIEFSVVPDPGYVFTPTSLDFVWNRSSTGPQDVTLRSSADGYTSDIGSVTGMAESSFAFQSIAISGITNYATSLTFRLYGYSATSAAGTGGFDINSNIVNVELEGTATCLVRNVNTSVYYCTLQSAIDAAASGHVIELLADITEGQVTINKSLTIDGNGFTLTSTSGNYGVEVDDPNITITDLTIENAGTFGLQVNCSSDNLVLTNVTVDNSGGTGVGLNGSDNAVITNLTSTNNTGNGISITDCNNITINGITTSGNAFMSGFNAGIGLFTSGVYCPPAGINGFTLSGSVSISEQTKVYSQKVSASQVITGLSGSSIAWAVGVGALDRSYWPDKLTSYAVVDALFEPPYNYPNTLVYVAEVATENFYVDDDPNGDASPPMLIQTAVNFEAPGETIFLEAGTFSERVTLNKSLTIDGQGAGSSILDGTGLAGTGNGITINSGITNVTIRDLTVRDYAGVNGNSNAGIYAIGGNNNLTVLNADLADNLGGSGFYANGPIDNVLIDNVDAHGHTTAARGIVIWNGHKSNITITNCEVYNNNCCGIELQDGSSSAVNISDNYVHDNADNGIGLVGMDGTTGSNLVEDNTVENNGRFGIEIKNPNGNGSNVVVNSNDVSRTLAIGDLRDIAGIAVFRRSVTGSNTDVPKGVTVTNNNVSGYVQPSNSEGFGIVIEGINHTVTGNTITGNDVGLQQQAGHTPYPGDGDQSNLADTYFGRGNSPMTCSNTLSSNTLSSNGVNTRNISVGGGLVTNTNTTEVFCSIQAAINDANTVAGHTISVPAGTFNEDVTINKSLSILGAGIDQSYVTGPIGGGGSTFQVSASGVLIDGFTISRDGNNTTDWNNPNLNIPGIAIQGQTVDAEIRNNKIIGNRTGIDVNNSNDNNIHNNIITFNRTGLIFRNQTDNTLFNENEVTNNWTVGVLFLDASGGSNSPIQSALNCSFNDNNISDNWYGDIVDRQTGGSLPPPGSNPKDFECNWYGTVTPLVSTANSSEPGYAAQIPVAYGGSAVPPGGQPNILGPASANFDYVSYLISGTDADGMEIGFQPAMGACSGTPVVISSAVASPETCAGNNGSILVTFSGGTAPYDIAWAGPDPGNATGVTSPYNITLLSAGAYTITVTDDNGTTGTASATVVLLPVSNTTQATNHATLQAAIDAANPGDVLEVCPATLTENITVNKALTINGPNAGIAGNGMRGAEAILFNCNIDVTATGIVVIDGFRIYQTDNNADVVLISGGTTATVQNCILDRDGVSTGAIVRAITTSSGSGVKTIQNNLFTGDKSSGLFGSHKTWNSGMYINGAASTVNISNNYFEYCRTALNLDDFNNGITISGNTLDSCGTFMSFGGVTPTNGQYVLGSNDFKDLVSTFMNLSNVNVAFRLDITSSTLNGALFNTYPLTTLFLVESTMYHRGRSGRNGLVYYVANNQYVVAGLTTIQSAVNYAASGNIINVNNGTYNEEVTVNLPVTIDGATGLCGDVVIEGGGVRQFGVRVLASVQNVTLRDFKVQNTVGANAGIWAATNNNGLNIQNLCLVNTAGTGAILAQGPVNGITINGCEVSGSGVNGRGIVIWDGFKENITITNNNVHDIGGCCGIELQDGSASGVTMNGNTVTNTGDSGMSAVGLTGSTGNNSISNNIITNTGRFGLEIKNPDGSGSDITLNSNQVTRTIAIGDARDIAGIAVFRRSVTSGNTDLPKGVVLTNNTVSGYVQPSNSEGFGIVIEGINHTVTNNTVTGNDVGIQQQAGHLPAPPADGDQSNLADNYFGRGNTQMTCSNDVSSNTLSSNGVDTRNVSVGGGLVTNTTTLEVFCSIQSAIDDANTVNTHTLSIEAGTYNENVIISKELTLTGAGNGSNPATNTVLTPSASCTGVAFTVNAANVTLQDLYVTNYQDAVQLNGVSNPTLNNLGLVDYCRYGVNFTGSLNTSVDITGSTIQRTSVLAGTVGLRAGTANGVDGLFINNSTINGNIQGMFIAQSSTPSAFNNITIQNSTISNNTQKGLYFEKLNNALLQNLTMDNNGTDAAYGFNNGIDINLKYDDYSDITIQNCDITNSGANGTATDPQNAAAITIKARDDAPSYNSNPATLTDVLIKNNRITGPQNGIRFGEFGKINEGPANVTVEGNDLSYAYAHKAIIRRTNDDVNLVCNWHGSTSLPTILAGIADAGTGSTILSSILTTGGDGSGAVGFQPSGSCGCPGGNLVTNTNNSETFCTLQAAIDDPDTDPNDILILGPGTYIENIFLNKPLDIRGNNYGINPNTGSRIAETVIMPYYSDPDPNSSTASVIFYMDASATGSSIDGILFDGDNPGLTSTVNINGANIDAIEAIAGYEGTGQLTISNNIIQHLSYCGIDMYNYYNSGGVTSDNYITNNKIDNIAQSPYGIGVLIYNNFYADVEDNVITRVRVGVQTGNFYSANTGATASISNNDIQSERRGIFHNLAYGSASSFTLNGNDITTVPGATNHLGISLSSLGGSVGAVVSNNNIDGAYAGIDFWNCTSSNTITVTGGNITDCDYGVVASNYDGYSSNANSGAGIISGVSISGSTVAAVHVKDNPLNSNNATIQLTINGDCEINGAGQLLTGVLVSGPDATAVVDGNDSSINGFAIGIDVNGGSATITNNHIYDNGIGIRFINGGTGDANTNKFYDVLPNGKDIEVAADAGGVTATPDNWFAGSSYGVDNASPLAVDATDCYWNNASGPGPVGPGSGANVSANVLYCPWLGDEPIDFGGTGAPSSSPVVTIGISETSGLANNDGIICTGATVTLDATSAGALSYLWSTTETTPSIMVSPGSTTMYSVTVTFAGCTDDASVTITVDPLPIVSGPSAVCVGNMIQMMPSTGGAWTSSDNMVATITNAGLVTGMSAGTVTFTFTDAATGCISTTPTVTVNPLPNATITSPEFAWENTGGYTASVPSAGMGATYNWNLSSGSISMGSGTNSITITTGAAGTLTIVVTVTDANGCSSTDQATIEVLPACLDIDFSDPVLLSPTQALGYWYVDRYEPQIFASQTAAPDATPNTLRHGIDASDGQATAFYNTQGRKHDLIDGTQAIQIDLYIPASWSSTGRRMAGMWGTAFDAGNAVSAFPIIEFTSDGGTPRFRGWESGTGTWVNIGLPSGFVYNNWVTLRTQLLPSGEFLYTVVTAQGTLQYTTTTSSGDGSVDIVNVILQGHNTTAGVTYDIYWDNFRSSTILTPDITAPTEVCASTTGNDASVTAYGGATYTWSVQGGTITNGQGTTDIEFTAGTGSQLTLSVLIETADCEVSISQIVLINPLPNATITTPPVVVTGTPNNPASIPDAGGGASYVWSLSSGTITGGLGTSSILYTAGPVGPLTISVTVTDGNGCVSTGSANVNVIAVGPSSVQWVPDNSAHGSCGASTNCCTDVICFGLEYTPGVTGNLTTYTTGFITNCLGGFPTGMSPINSNQSCVMSNNSFEINGCAVIDSVLFNSSGNSGMVPVVAGTPIIIHKVCFNLSAGDVIGIREDVITNLSASVDLTGGGQYTEFPSYSTTNLSKPLPVIPGNGSSTVACVSQATQPTPPVVVDYCGNPVPVALTSTVNTPNPILCEGTRVYNFTYTDCAGQTYPWSYTYTIEVEDFAMPSNDGSTVACIALATQPTPPAVNDFCGNPITPTGPSIGGTYAGCEGTRTYTWNYIDCEGNDHDWVYTYTIEVEDFSMPANNGSTVACIALATQPTPPVVNDYCGNPIIPTGPTIGGTYVNCEGTRTFTWNYADCEGNNHDWVYTYTIEVEDFTMPANDASTVACIALAIQPTPPVVNDNCGNPITPTGPAISGSYAGCEGTRIYTWNYADCEGNNHDWVYTYTIEVEDFTMPVNDGSTVACIALATQPTPPVVNDYCGNPITPTGPSISGSYAGCEGTRIYTWNYADCEGNNHDWVYTYTIEVEDFSMPANNGSTVECASSATVPTPPTVNDYCGNPITPTGPVTGGTYAGCEGTITYTWNYADCEGNTHDWVYTYTVDRTSMPFEVGGPVPTSSTIDCPADAVPPVLPVVKDICGATLMPSGPVIGGTNTGGCTGTITYTYTYTDCAMLQKVWVYTYTVDCDALTLRVFLEGPYNAGTNLMETDLNDNHVLPGQDKLLSPNIGIQLGAPFTPFGQPYNTAPWNYNGNTGMNFGDASAPGAPMGVIPYPTDVVDWVLVTIRKNGLLPANNHWSCAGWVHDDGEVTFPESCGTFSVDVMDNYYVLIQHRNHLGVLTPSAVDELCGGLTLDWDFTTSNSYQPIFRYGQIEVEPGTWAMLKANGEQISSINAISSPDRTTWRVLQNALGYSIGDYNMNASTTSGDETDWKDNQNKTSGVIFY